MAGSASNSFSLLTGSPPFLASLNSSKDTRFYPSKYSAHDPQSVMPPHYGDWTGPAVATLIRVGRLVWVAAREIAALLR
ncbi:hypothetical protein GCM10022232_59050 [Streptomyces plumbiresistens]|uniref:Uncharacterized protein n=1 Tax=Streptomyces plumbiresistens TaxID=511811 RepID=A0ABP7SDY4_9ACTN